MANEDVLNVTIVGDSGVGKTSIFNKWQSEPLQIVRDTVGQVGNKKFKKCVQQMSKGKFDDIMQMLTSMFVQIQ